MEFERLVDLRTFEKAERKTIVYEGRVYDWALDSGRIQIDGTSTEHPGVECGHYPEDDLLPYEGKRVRVTMTIEVLDE